MNKFGQLENRPQRRVPLSTKGLTFMQEQIMLLSELAGIAGETYILSGCVQSGTNVSSGTLIVNGEIMPFRGGSMQSTFIIVETKESVTVGSETYDDFYIRRHAEFGTSLNEAEEHGWAGILRFPKINTIRMIYATKAEVAAVNNSVMPKGAIIMWSGAIAAIPAGFALCDGSTVNGVVTPNLRGRFIVGYDLYKALNPTNVTDTAENYGKIGNTGGRNTVSLITAEIPSHTHTITRRTPDSGSNDRNYISGTRSSSNAKTDDDPIGTTGGSQAHENRPAYYVLAFIMKVV
jgi:hypothetical protein